MANHRKKKKKSAAASKQAATQYKGKNAPVRPAAAPKKVEEKKTQQAQPKVEKATKPQKTETKPEKKAQQQPAAKKDKKAEASKANTKQKKTTQTKKNAPQTKKGGKKKSVQKKKLNSNIKLSKRIKMQIEWFGVRKFAAIVLAVSFAICAACVIAWVTSSTFGIPDEALPKYAGRNISSASTLTVLEDIDKQYEYSDNMGRKGDKKEFRYYAAKEIVFAEKNSQGSLNLVNVTDNNCVLIASIVDEAGNVCYSSLGLPVGQCLTDISIYQRPYGTYDMKLVVAGYDPETYELIGVQHSDLTVQVGIEEETSNVQETTQGE